MKRIRGAVNQIRSRRMRYERRRRNVEKRHEPRFPCSGEARITDCETQQDLGYGLLTDVSASGACLRVYCPLKLSSVIELRQGEVAYRGVIRSCLPWGPDFRVGIQLIPAKQWSPNQQWPALI